MPRIEWWYAEATKLGIKPCRKCHGQARGRWERTLHGRALLYHCQTCGEREYVMIQPASGQVFEVAPR